VQIEVRKNIAADPASAFAVVANIMEWPQIFNSVRSVELLTSGPIRPGTRLREHRRFLGRDTLLNLEIGTLERPHRLCMLVQNPDLHYEWDHLIDAIYAGGSRLMLVFRSRPETPAGRTLQPLMSPLMGVTLRDELESDLSDLAVAIARIAATRN